MLHAAASERPAKALFNCPVPAHVFGIARRLAEWKIQLNRAPTRKTMSAFCNAKDPGDEHAAVTR